MKIECPFCKIILGEFKTIKTNIEDVLYKDNEITIFLASDGWKNNQGHVLIIPNEHYENIYVIPDELLAKISKVSKQVAILLKEAYECEGITIRQNNEPAGGQDVFHYHLHVFPRYINDNFNNEKRLPVLETTRNFYAKKIASQIKSLGE